MLVRLTVDEREPPAEKAKLLGLAEIEKSPATLNTTLAEWESPPLVAVTMNEYVPRGVEGVVEMVTVKLPDPPDDRVTEVVLSDAVGPLLTTGETENPPTWKPTCTWL